MPAGLSWRRNGTFWRGRSATSLYKSQVFSLSLFDTESALGNDSASFEEKKEGRIHFIVELLEISFPLTEVCTATLILSMKGSSIRRSRQGSHR